MITSENVLEELIDKYGNTIYKISFTYLKNKADAEDAVQEIFIKLMHKLPDFSNEEHEKAWIIRVTLNHCKNKIKASKRWDYSPIEETKDIASYDKYSENPEVLDAVLSLDEKYRTAVYLYYYEGYTTPQIAKITKQAETTVRSLLHRARLKLKNKLKEEYDFE